MNIKIKLVHPLAKLPEQQHDTDAGWDVFATEIIKESDDFYIVKLGFSLEIPIGYKCVLVPRSSITKTKWLVQNSPGQGDPTYRGEYQYRFRAIPDVITVDNTTVNGLFSVTNQLAPFVLKYPEFPYKVGERIGQIFFEEIVPFEWEVVNELSDTARGAGGFGSTGK